jgi:hypothetical protein
LALLLKLLALFLTLLGLGQLLLGLLLLLLLLHQGTRLVFVLVVEVRVGNLVVAVVVQVVVFLSHQ